MFYPQYFPILDYLTDVVTVLRPGVVLPKLRSPDDGSEEMLKTPGGPIEPGSRFVGGVGVGSFPVAVLFWAVCSSCPFVRERISVAERIRYPPESR